MARILCTCAQVCAICALCGCQASGRASGGDTQMERTTEKPTTREVRMETFGRAPTPEEIAVFADLWKKPEVKK